MFLENGPMTSIFSIPPPGSYASSHPVFPIELCSLNDIFSWHLCFHKRKTPTKKPLSDVFIFKIMEILLYNMFLRERWGKILENHWVKKRVFFFLLESTMALIPGNCGTLHLSWLLCWVQQKGESWTRKNVVQKVLQYFCAILPGFL